MFDITVIIEAVFALLAAVTIDTLQTRAAENAAKRVTGQAPAESQSETAAK